MLDVCVFVCLNFTIGQFGSSCFAGKVDSLQRVFRGYTEMETESIPGPL